MSAVATTSGKQGGAMTAFLKIPCLSADEERKIEDDIAARVEAKKKEGRLTDREIRDIQEMRLHPLPDIQDVQNVYENHLFTKKS
jgi:hypothetical protein